MSKSVIRILKIDPHILDPIARVRSELPEQLISDSM
jgi:hypothetical protein